MADEDVLDAEQGLYQRTTRQRHTDEQECAEMKLSLRLVSRGYLSQMRSSDQIIRVKPGLLGPQLISSIPRHRLGRARWRMTEPNPTPHLALVLVNQQRWPTQKQLYVQIRPQIFAEMGQGGGGKSLRFEQA
ncbi:predicted protein [Histoplasma mississippiense (nom. inval.)]|uniref:predicted protein n=1 Tax=Ajellomyces capsulatus (strain NAm1 / WU24) TaxID=2059318 RepID=UPI000157CDB0|nr:predicted protein [Histoplasma mississippiense (nom. inval.)]EDN09970.1 predicted protein [Histoplasma mississippiense (nom. inval.)]